MVLFFNNILLAMYLQQKQTCCFSTSHALSLPWHRGGMCMFLFMCHRTLAMIVALKKNNFLHSVVIIEMNMRMMEDRHGVVVGNSLFVQHGFAVIFDPVKAKKYINKNVETIPGPHKYGGIAEPSMLRLFYYLFIFSLLMYISIFFQKKKKIEKRRKENRQQFWNFL